MRERIAYRRLYAAEDLGNGFGPLAARFSPRLDMTEPAASTYVRTSRRWAGEILKELKSAGVRTSGITPLCGAASAPRGIRACESVASGDTSPAFSCVLQAIRGGAASREADIGQTVPLCPMRTGATVPPAARTRFAHRTTMRRSRGQGVRLQSRTPRRSLPIRAHAAASHTGTAV